MCVRLWLTRGVAQESEWTPASTQEPLLTPASTRVSLLTPAPMPGSMSTPAVTPESLLMPASTQDSRLTRGPLLTPEWASTRGVTVEVRSMAVLSRARCASAAGVPQAPLDLKSGGWL
jgi:hypothetical protein